MKNPANENDWPGVIIWSDHGVHAERITEEFRTSATNIGQQGIGGLAAGTTWASRVPQRFSYYGVQLGSDKLSRDLDNTAAATLRPVGANFTQTAVVSYGALFRDATAGQHAAVWRPGVRTLNEGGRQSWCEPYDGGGVPSVDMVDALAVGAPAGNPCTTRVPVAPPTVPATFVPLPSQAAALLAATRSGFRDGFAELESCGGSDNSDDGTCTTDAKDRRRGNILPMNFDLTAFQEALADTTPGELGFYFCAPGVPSCGAFMTRPFNGIVYIAAPYPGSERGYAVNGGNNTPAQLPIPGRRNDLNGVALELQGVNNAGHLNNAELAASLKRHDASPAADDVSWPNNKALPILMDRQANGDPGQYDEARDDEVAALPYALCSDAGGAPPVLTTGGYQFVRPDCSNDQTFTRINGIRIINARRVNSNTPPIAAAAVAEPGSIPGFPGAPVLSAAALGRLPKGISIISNLPVYVVGDVNITSDAWDNPANNRPWVPVLIGGDVVHPLSNFWNDTNARWALSNGQQARPAMVTRYYMEMLSGWGMSVAAGPSGGVHNFPRALENWSNEFTPSCKGTADFTDACPAIIRGSLVIGHHRVYTSWRFREDDIGRSPPRRDWGFDDHLLDLEKQPPGAPLFDVAAVKQWSRH